MQNDGSALRPIHTAVLLAVGSELTVGETRDTNSGDIAGWLTEAGVEVAWISALPDRLATVTAALRSALETADLVVTTGGLGPTPDDLTREAIAEVCCETPAVDPKIEGWLRHLWERRNMPFPESNVKQAWLIPSSTALANDHGTAPGWWVDRPDGRVVVALPGPPSEMRPMWSDGVMPRLRDRGLGLERVARTYRLTGIGESIVADLLGESLLRATNPVVATYARSDAVDVRVSAVAEGGRTADEIAAAAEATVLAILGRYVWGHQGDTWPSVIGRALQDRGWNVALSESGTGGATARLMGDAAWLASAELAAPGGNDPRPAATIAGATRDQSGATIGLAVRAIETGEDTTVEIAAVGPFGTHKTRTTAFLGGPEGRRRAGIAAAAFLHQILREA